MALETEDYLGDSTRVTVNIAVPLRTFVDNNIIRKPIKNVILSAYAAKFEGCFSVELPQYLPSVAFIEKWTPEFVVGNLVPSTEATIETVVYNNESK